MKENALEAALHSHHPYATMTTESTETEALLKKDASASPEPNAKSARVGGYVKAGLALAGVLGVCALGKAFEGNLVDAYRVAVGGKAARLAGHARPAHHYISHSNRPGGLFNTCEGKCPAVSVDFDAVTHEPGHAADRAAHLYLIGDTTDRLWHDGFCNDMLTSTERCPYRCAMPEPAALPGNVVPYMCDDPSADTCAAETAGNSKCCESKWMPNGAKAYQCCVTTSQATTATACRPRHYATGGGTAGFLHVLGASAEGELGDKYFSAKDSPDPPPLGAFESYNAATATQDRIARGLRGFVRWNQRDGAAPRPIVTTIQSNAQETWRKVSGTARVVAREVGEEKDDADTKAEVMTKSEEDAFVNEYADGLRAAIRQVRNILDEENAGEGKEWESGPVEQVPMAGDNERLAAVGFQPRLEQVQASIQGAVPVQGAVQGAVQQPHVDKVPAPGEPIVDPEPQRQMTEPERLASDKKLEEDKAYWAELQRSADAAMDPASRHILRGAVGERNPGDPITAAAANAAAAAAAYASANAGAAASLGAIPTELMRSNGNMGSDSDIKAERIVLNPGSDQDAMARAFANVEKAEQAKLAGHYVGATGDIDDVVARAGDSAVASEGSQQTVSAAAPAAHVAVGNSGSDCVVLRTADAEETGPSLLGVPSNVRESVQRLRRRLNDATMGIGEEMNVPVYRWDEHNSGKAIPGLGQYMEDGHHQTYASSMAHVRLFKEFVRNSLPAHCRLA